MFRKVKWGYFVILFSFLSCCIVSCKSLAIAHPSTNVYTNTPSNLPPTKMSTESVSTFKIGDGGLFSEQSSCKPPCLLGITPGVTRESEAWDILESKQLSNKCNVWDNTRESGTRGIKCVWSKGSISIDLASEDDAIRFVGFTPSKTIKISQVLEKYGTPSWIAVWGEGGIPEYPTIGITIFYDEIMARFDFIDQDGSVYKIRPDDEIRGVSYLSVQEYENYIQVIKDRLYNWKGYGEYEIH